MAEKSNPTAPLDTIWLGDSWAVVRSLPSDCVQCIVTGPPYFGHREYSDDPSLSKVELGREEEPTDYVRRFVLLFEELRRVLREDGTLWLNLGDTYRKE